MPVIIECLVCKIKFSVTPNRADKAKMCSVKCKAEYQKSLSLENQPAWKGGVVKRNGYLAVKQIDGSYQYQHRLVMEKKLGRTLNTKEVIHHIDGNTLNNSEDNLELLSKKEHDRKETSNRWDKHRKGDTLFRSKEGGKYERR